MPIRLTFFDVVLFAFMIVAFVIGIHQSLYHGVAASYWLFMLSSLCFLWLNKRLKSRQKEGEPSKETPLQNPKTRKKGNK
jgi:hypothetical protein